MVIFMARTKMAIFWVVWVFAVLGLASDMGMSCLVCLSGLLSCLFRGHFHQTG